MTQSTPRRWFQFHLATAVVVMIAASGLLALEFCEWKTFKVSALSYMASGKREIAGILEQEDITERGFPWTCWSRLYTRVDLVFEPPTEPDGVFNVKFLILNSVVIVLGLSALAFTTEFILRRSAARARGRKHD